MINQQLLDYVRRQMSTGVSKEEISKSLIASGWQVSDINEAFSSLASVQSIPQPSTPSPTEPMKDSNLMIKKSILYKILRSSIVTLGSVSLLVILLANLSGLLGGGWTALILVSIVAPYIEGGVIFCAVLFVLYCLMYFLKWKKEGYAFGKAVLVIGILSILPIVVQVYLNFTIQKAQTSFEKANPIVTDTQSYDFSKDVLFHTTIYPAGINSFNVQNVSIKDNLVVWQEYTKQSPQYPTNAIDVFLFKFDPASSKGKVTQITQNDASQVEYWNPQIIDGKMYWIQGIPYSSQRDLVVYDLATGKQEVLLKKESDTTSFSLAGGYGNYLMLVRGITKPDGYSGNAVSFYNILTKSESPLDEWSAEAAVFGDGYFCHATKDYNIGIYDVEKKQELIVKTADNTKSTSGEESSYGMHILGCTRNYIVYSYIPAGRPGTPAIAESHLLTLKKDGTASDQKLKAIQDIRDTTHNQFVLVNKYLFYATGNSLYRKDLSNGNETEVLTSDGLNGWNTDGNYFVYQTPADQGKSTFYLKKISQ